MSQLFIDACSVLRDEDIAKLTTENANLTNENDKLREELEVYRTYPQIFGSKWSKWICMPGSNETNIPNADYMMCRLEVCSDMYYPDASDQESDLTKLQVAIASYESKQHPDSPPCFLRKQALQGPDHDDDFEVYLVCTCGVLRNFLRSHNVWTYCTHARDENFHLSVQHCSREGEYLQMVDDDDISDDSLEGYIESEEEEERMEFRLSIFHA